MKFLSNALLNLNSITYLNLSKNSKGENNIEDIGIKYLSEPLKLMVKIEKILLG